MNITVAVEALNSPSADERRQATHFLLEQARLGPKDKAHVPALVLAITRVHDEEARLAAIEALGAIGPQARDAVPVLTKTAVADESVSVQDAASEALKKVDPEATSTVPALVKEIHRGGDRVRNAAIIIVSKFGPLARPALARAIKSVHGEDHRILTLALEAITSHSPIEKSRPAGDSEIGIVADTIVHGGIVPTPIEGTTPPPSAATEMAAVINRHIPKLSGSPEEKAKAIIALNQTLNQAFWQELRPEAEPLIKSLLEDIPADYEGKRTRAVLINALLTALKRGILIHDEDGRPHVCSVTATHGRATDVTGNFRLLERARSGSSQKSYPIPSMDKTHIIETRHRERADHREPDAATRGV